MPDNNPTTANMVNQIRVRLLNVVAPGTTIRSGAEPRTHEPANSCCGPVNDAGS